MRAAAMAASQPACPAPTTTTSNCSVKGGTAAFILARSAELNGGRASRRPAGRGRPAIMQLELRTTDICERDFLPLGRGKIPVAGAGFMIIAARTVRDRRGAPV